MKWITGKPTQPGYYWIYTIPIGEDEPVLDCVGVAINNGKTSFDTFRNGYECEDDISPERTTHWMGPLEKPDVPE